MGRPEISIGSPHPGAGVCRPDIRTPDSIPPPGQPAWIRRELGIPPLHFGMANFLIGALFILVGFIYAAWSILSQVVLANGTRVPVMPTQKLLMVGPFKQCRNPMVFGTVMAYLGCSILAGSLLSAAAVILFTVLLVIYIKRIEEKELEARFGQEYLDYKQSTPFIIPEMIRRKGKK